MNKRTFYIIMAAMLAMVAGIAALYLSVGSVKIPVSFDTGIFNEKKAQNSTSPQESGEKTSDFNNNDSVAQISDAVADKGSEEYILEKREEAGIFDDNIKMACVECEDLYYYRNMDANLQNLYAELYIILKGRSFGVPISSVDDQEIERAFTYLCCDHPEFYYTDGYETVKHYRDDSVQYIEFSPIYIFTDDEINEIDNQLKSYVKAYKIGIPQDASDYEKIKYTYDFLCLNMKYDENAANNQSIVSMVLSNKGVCTTYSKGFQYLLSEIGIEATIVYDGEANEYNHMYNLVKCDGAYYFTDVTWGDMDGKMHGFSEMPSYDYLNITTSELLKNHNIIQSVKFPNCVSTTDNYYYKEDLVVESFDEDRIQEIINRSISDGSNIAYIKCKNKETYDLVTNVICTDKLFSYLPSNFKVANSSKNESLLTIMVVWK